MKKIILFFAVLFLTIYTPVSITIYSLNWYEYNYENQNTYEHIEKENALFITKNLINFFLYQENLGSEWNDKEKKHMSDVRKIYSGLFILAIISFLFILHIIRYFDISLIKIYSISNNITIIFIGILIIIFDFNYIFDNFFHPLFFDNNNWILNSDDISYYLFPYEFFQRSLMFILVVTIIENLIIFLLIKKYKNQHLS